MRGKIYLVEQIEYKHTKKRGAGGEVMVEEGRYDAREEGMEFPLKVQSHVVCEEKKTNH